jgi:3-oxoacyl-[acyl-carrier-protein] synthase-3
MFRSVITGAGSFIPPIVKANRDFAQDIFYSSDQQALPNSQLSIVEKFKEITGIEERRYASDEQIASDIGAIAGQNAIADSGIDPEEIDQLIVAHNFGNVGKDRSQMVAVPSLASLIKNRLGIRNPSCVAYDILFGCPGWLQGVIQADAFFKAGIARRALIIGTETLSRIIDRYDRDSMLFSDGAGAVVLEYKESGEAGAGVLSVAAETHATEGVDYINMGPSFYPGSDRRTSYIKMKGRKVYEFAMKHVPMAMKNCLDKSGVRIEELKKVFIHQANGKMDEGITKRLFKLYGIEQPPEHVMPMTIHWLGNSSVATIPSLLDLVRKKQVPDHVLAPGDVILLASVGAGMNINAVCYRC